MFNAVTLIGNVGKDPEIRYTTSGKAVASFSLATSEKHKDSQGQIKEETQWHRVIFWGKQAESIGQYAKKGTSLLVTGKITYRKFTNRDNQEQSITEIMGDNFKFVGGKKDSSSAPATPSGEAEPGADPDLPDIPF